MQKAAARDLTEGNITATLLRFAWPIMLGNLLQQMYNVADTLIVGQFIGKEALAAAVKIDSFAYMPVQDFARWCFVL